MSSPSLVARGAGFRYRGTDRLQIRDLEFSVEPGTKLAVMGAAGSGKSTFAMMFNGLVPHHHAGDLFGELIVAGLPTHLAKISELVQLVGLVTEDPESQITARRVLDEAAVGPANLGLPREAVWARAEAALTAVGLDRLADRDTAQLSGGQLQRLAIAGVLAMQPAVLVLDEPVAQLDPQGAADIYRIADACSAQGQTVVLIDNDADRILQWADELLVLNAGRQVFFGSPTSFFADPDAVSSAGLQLPGVTAVWHAAQAADLVGSATSVRCVDDVVKLLSAASDPKLVQATTPGDRPVPYQQPLPALDEHPNTAPSAMNSAPPAIETRELTHRYASGVTALRGVNLRIEQGEFVALLGANGAGKTTFARHLNNLLTPSSGEVLISGSPTAGKQVNEMAGQVGYVFQNPDHQIFAATVFDEIAFGLRNQGLNAAEIEARVDEALAQVDLSGLADEHPFKLSRGDRQRVSVAAVLAMRPQILVIDEPTTGQDRRGSIALLDMISQLHRAGHTIVMITHDMTLASQYAERAVVFKDGALALDQPMAELFLDLDRLAELHLVAPPIVEIAVRLGLPPLQTPDELIRALLSDHER